MHREQVDFETPIHGVASVRLGFKQNTGNLKVNEIQILGFIPPDIEYTVGIPRLLINARNAEIMAEAAYRQWTDLFLPDQNTPIMQEEQEEFVFTYQKGTMDILQVTIDKHTGEATTEELVELVSRLRESDEQTIPASGEN